MTDDAATPGERGEAAGDGEEPDAGAARAARLAALLSVELRTTPTAEDDAVSAEESPDTDADADAGDTEADGDGTPPLAVARPGAGRSAAWFAVLVVLLIGGVGLAYAGSRIIRSSTEGEVLTPIDDPTAPGYEALVDPTPTLALLQDVNGALDSVTVLTLPDPGGSGGGVLLIPTRTVTDVPIFGESPLAIAYNFGDSQIATEVVGTLLGTGLGESAVVDDTRWADLVAPVAPITIDNPNALSVDGELRFPVGEIQLQAADVGPYLTARVDGESDLARLFRQQVFWSAWLDAVKANGTTAAVPGELDTGIGRFVRALAAGQRVISTLPVQPTPAGEYGDEEAFVTQPAKAKALVDQLVPFPVSPAPGARARLRLLNGTPDTSVAASIAADLPAAGVQVVLIGNATSLDHETTTVRYIGAEFRDEAQAVADILGVGEVTEDNRPSETADITVTLGADYG